MYLLASLEYAGVQDNPLGGEDGEDYRARRDDAAC